MTQLQAQQQNYQQLELNLEDVTPSDDEFTEEDMQLALRILLGCSEALDELSDDDDDDIVCIINEEGRCSSCEE
jgi:hypothetical protein